jgi:predicted ATPase/class 3 adenylate cyclase
MSAAMVEQPSGTVTFLFTDVEGSTRLLHKLGAEVYREALVEHRRLLREAFDRHGGYEVDYEGDAFFVAFADAPEAVAAAAEAQRALANGPIRVRMGLHTGEPLLDPPKYVGVDVHRAARIMSAGHGGQVLLSQATCELVAVEMQDLGEHRLKDLLEPERLYQFGDARFPPLKTLYRANLPIQPTEFLGRERELAEVLGLLRETRLLTLTGVGGTGKTRLALQAAAEAVDDYSDGVWWVPLAALREPRHVLDAVAQTLDAKGELHKQIADKRLLLLLDNFEHVIDAAADVAELLTQCPNLRLLVTSRELLHVRAERQYPVPPLVDREAVGFFNARARTANPDHQPTSEVAEICERLDNLPLALELAAAHSKTLTPGQILDQLARRLAFLAGGYRDLPQRQQTLLATIAWSHDLLTPPEQQLFHRLAVFIGGSTRDAATAVADAGLDTLQSLVDKNLLRHVNDRYQMLETIREYAGDRLEESGEASELRGRLVDWLLELLTTARATIQEAETIAGLDDELTNIRGAAEWLQVTGRGRELIQLARYVWIYLLIRSPNEARSLLEAAVALSPDETEDRARALNGLANCILNTSGDLAAAEEIARESVEVSRKIGFSARGGLATLGVVATMRGRFEEAQEFYEETARISERTGDAEGLRDARIMLGDLALNRGDFAKAEALSEQALPLLGERGQYTLVVLINIAFARLKKGDPGGAVEVSRESLEFLRELGPTFDLRSALEVVAAVAVAHDACRAATLLGASEALESQYGSLPPFESSVHEETIEMLERRPRGEWQSCWEQGSRLEPAKAIETGLAVCSWLSRATDRPEAG